MAKFKGRLDRSVRPLNYRLCIDTNLKTFRFGGEEWISLDVGRRTREIALNSDQTKVHNAYVESRGKRQKARIRIDRLTQRVFFIFSEAVYGKAVLHVSFSGENNDNMYGFYRSSFGEGKKRFMLSSQFEPSSARYAFPCFDEPSFKATFDFSLIVDKGLDAISNMPVKSTDILKNSRKRVNFCTTPRMSSYLLYMGVGKYDYIEGGLGKLRIRVLTTPGKRKFGFLALDYAKQFIKFYEKYFGIKYPLPKLDLIAVPDFAAGAMENWGAITFRESALLGGKDSSISMKENIAITVSHELTHQWFGDLVTMEWWDDLWLNESFATFMSYKAIDSVFPAWKMGAEFIDDSFGSAFAADQLKNTHPIHVPIKDPGDIESSFDKISYEKGSCVLYMLEDFVGKEEFREGLHSYLMKHSYANALAEDLWGALDDSTKKRGSRKPVSKVARAWVTMPGYPVLAARHNGQRISVEQTRFYLIKNMKDSGLWPVPLHYAAESGKSGFKLIQGRVESLDVGSASWVKLNYGQAGFYRVFYDPEMMEEIGKLIVSKKLPEIDAWGIGGDLFVLARSGRISAKRYLEYASSYLMNSGYPLNVSVLGALGWIYSMLYGNDIVNVTDAYLKYSRKLFERLGWEASESEDNQTKTLRVAVIVALGILGYKPVVNRAMELFDEVLKGKDIDANLRRAIYPVVGWNFGGYSFAKFLEIYQKAEVPEEKICALIGLGTQGEERLIMKALDLSMSGKIRLQDSYLIPMLVAKSHVGREIIWDWTRRNWKLLMKKYNPEIHMLDGLVGNLSGQYTQKARNQIAAFFRDKRNMRSDIKREVAQTLERIDANIAFMKANFGK